MKKETTCSRSTASSFPVPSERGRPVGRRQFVGTLPIWDPPPSLGLTPPLHYLVEVALSGVEPLTELQPLKQSVHLHYSNNENESSTLTMKIGEFIPHQSYLHYNADWSL